MICPRCAIERKSFNRCECGLAFEQEGGKNRFPSYRLMIFGLGSVCWDIGGKYCTFRHPNGTEVRLPWLPYTVLTKDLQKYLVLV